MAVVMGLGAVVLLLTSVVIGGWQFYMATFRTDDYIRLSDQWRKGGEKLLEHQKAVMDHKRQQQEARGKVLGKVAGVGLSIAARMLKK